MTAITWADQLATTIAKKGTMNTNDITVFEVTIDKSPTGGYDVQVRINDRTELIAFAPVARGKASGYAFLPLTLSQFPAALQEQAHLLEWSQLDVAASGGLTVTEVRKRGAVLAGLYLAGKTLA